MDLRQRTGAAGLGRTGGAEGGGGLRKQGGRWDCWGAICWDGEAEGSAGDGGSGLVATTDLVGGEEQRATQ